MAFQKWRYTPENSPWSYRTLWWLWSIQINYLTGMVIHAIVFMALPAPKSKDLRRDSFYEDHKSTFRFICYILFGFALISYVFFTIQIREYRRCCLNPLAMLIMSVIANAHWSALMILNAALLGLQRDEGEGCNVRWDRYEIMMLLDCFLCLPSMYQMVYVCIVFDRFNRSWKKIDKPELGTELKNF